jgi:hypothetical protein
MNILPQITIPTPFGNIKTHALETPPMKFPTVPDAHGKAALKQAVGADLIDLSDTILDVIPGADIVGALLDPVRDSIADMHEKEILGILTKEEYADYLEYNKVFPRTVAMARTMCFKQPEKPVAKVTKPGHGLAGILPMPPSKGPPLPAAFNIYWPEPKTKES